ncbi:MAG: CPBP family intramembrane metalloprotease [Oscillospiraceae bacterium]|nr:CPBP family intramembrane metalloprotease [Oscillospiraceae bacterium]
MERELNSRLSKAQAIAVLVWLPVHSFLLPTLAVVLIRLGLLPVDLADLAIYAAGAVYMLAVLWRFLRRDFDPLWEHPFRVLLMVFGGYLASVYGQVLVGNLLDLLSVTAQNENNAAVEELAKAQLNTTTVMAVFMAPLVEEGIFRAGIFGLLRRKHRVLAYVLSALLFGLYHVWSEAIYDPIQLVFILQYVPSSLVLAYIYDRTDSIWSSIFLHMLTNGIAIAALLAQ